MNDSIAQYEQKWAAELNRARRSNAANHGPDPDLALEQIQKKIQEHTARLMEKISQKDATYANILLGKLFRLRASQVRAHVQRDKKLYGKVSTPDLSRYLKGYYEDCERARASVEFLLSDAHGNP